MNSISTLRTEGLTNTRRDGNTTRQIDFAIQKLHEGYMVYCHDHHKIGKSRQANFHLIERILKRISREHTHLIDIIIVNYNDFSLCGKQKKDLD